MAARARNHLRSSNLYFYAARRCDRTDSIDFPSLFTRVFELKRVEWLFSAWRDTQECELFMLLYSDRDKVIFKNT